MTHMPRSRRALLMPLVLATMASQALLVVLSPTVVAIGDDLSASVAAVGQARSVTAIVAIVASAAITGRIGAIGVPRLLVLGSIIALAACAAVAASQNLWTFLAAHVLVGVGFACLLSGGFAGVAAFAPMIGPGRSVTSQARMRSRGSSSIPSSAL